MARVRSRAGGYPTSYPEGAGALPRSEWHVPPFEPETVDYRPTAARYLEAFLASEGTAWRSTAVRDAIGSRGFRRDLLLRQLFAYSNARRRVDRRVTKRISVPAKIAGAYRDLEIARACAARRIRREVLFSRGKAGRGRKTRKEHYRRDLNSQYRC